MWNFNVHFLSTSAGPLSKSATVNMSIAVRFIDHDYHIIAIKSTKINCAMRLVAVDRVAPWTPCLAMARPVASGPVRIDLRGWTTSLVSRQSDPIGNFGSITQTAAKSSAHKDSAPSLWSQARPPCVGLLFGWAATCSVSGSIISEQLTNG